MHVITGLTTGGAEMMLRKLLGGLDPARTTSHVLTLTDGGALRPAIEALGVPVETVGIGRGRLPSPGALARLRRMVRAVRPDVVQAWMYHGNLAAQAACTGTRIPVLWNVRSSLADDGSEKRLTSLVIRAGARASRYATHVVYPSRESARQHEAIGYAADRRVLISNGFDVRQFAPDPSAGPALRHTLGLPSDSLVVGHVARFHPMKDHAGLLRAAAILLRDLPQVHFVLVGRGVDDANVELGSLARELGIADRVLFLGERRDVAALTPGFDLATNSSSWGEAFPNVLGEAMACGVPCVATDVGDSAEIVADTGRIVPPRDAAALAAAWYGLLAAPAAQRTCLGAAARARVLAKYALESVVARYEELWRSAAEGRRCMAAVGGF